MLKHMLVPSLRTAVAGQAAAPSGGSQRRQVRIGVQVVAGGVAHGAPRELAADLLGAGDIVSLHPSMVGRVEPGPGARAAEPNYFPYIDFVDADFPWRYTLDLGPASRLRPWLLLVALQAAEFRHLGRGAGPLPRIEVFKPAASLPQPAQSWAYAHAQLTVPDGAADVRDVLAAAPEAGHARLMCPRRLEDNAGYTLFLVPTYEAGRLAGIGAGGKAQPWDAFAWDPGSSQPVELPIYRQWAFRTSSLEDFESLVRRLQPISPEAGSAVGGTRTVFAGKPGYYRDFEQPGLEIEAEGALQHVEFERTPPVIELTGLTSRLEQTLTGVIRSDLPAGQEDGPDQEDPLVALPVYGRHFARPDAIDVEETSTPWIHQVNLDLRLRLAAGVGARIVKRQQEELMEKCWQQVGEIREANRLRARLQTVTRLNDVMAAKHLAPLAPEEAELVAGPLLHTVKTPFGGNRTMRADLRVRGVPDGQRSPLVRRLAAKRPDLAPVASGFRAATPHSVAFARLAVPGEAEIGRATRRIEALRAAVAEASDLAQLIPEQLAAVHAISFDRPSFEVGPVDSATMVELVTDRIRELPGRKATELLIGVAGSEQGTLEPIMRGPRLPVPVSAHVAEEDANHLLPHVGELPDNSVALLMENRVFVEALMAGANHEMNRELRWREFPTDMRGSPFTRFWDRGEPPEDDAGDDLLPLHQWDGEAGSHFRRGGEPNLTLVIHGDLVRRYPDLIVAANRQVIPRGGRWEASRGSTIHPIFTGVIGDATGFYGFDLSVADVRATLDEYYFVLYEPASRFRFGLDIATYGVRTSRRRLGRAPMPFPLATMSASRRAVRIRDVQTFWNAPSQTPGPVPQDPDDLSWEHVALDGARYVDFSHGIAFADGSDLLGPDRTSASIARATLQRPVSAVVPAARMVSDA